MPPPARARRGGGTMACQEQTCHAMRCDATPCHHCHLARSPRHTTPRGVPALGGVGNAATRVWGMGERSRQTWTARETRTRRARRRGWQSDEVDAGPQRRKAREAQNFFSALETFLKTHMRSAGTTVVPTQGGHLARSREIECKVQPKNCERGGLVYASMGRRVRGRTSDMGM